MPGGRRVGVGRPGLAGVKELGMKRTGLHITTFDAPLMTFTPVMFFFSFFMLLLLLVLAGLHGEMGGGSGLLDGCISMETACFFRLSFFFYISFFVQPFEPYVEVKHEGQRFFSSFFRSIKQR